jgi:hypothetical protein
MALYLIELRSPMKNLKLLMICCVLSFSPSSHAEGWLDTLKNLFSDDTPVTPVTQVLVKQTIAPNVTDMISSVSGATGITAPQAEASLGALFNYVKTNLSAEEFDALSNSLPGLNSLLSAAPDVSKMTRQSGLDGLVDKAANYNESLKALNDVKDQFASLGLNQDMLSQVISSVSVYLDTPEGQNIRTPLILGLSKLPV